MTLDEILNAPDDPNALNQHLMGKGLIPLPPVEPSPLMATVQPMSPVGAALAIGATNAPTVKPMSRVDTGAAPDLGGGGLPSAVPRAGEPVKPMSRVSAEAAPDLGGNLPGAAATGPGVVAPMTKPDISKAIVSNAAERKEKLEGMRPQITAPYNSSDYWKQKAAQSQFDIEHPWGSELNHPGVLGKIGHIAALAGETAGSMIRPDIVQAIPGTRANLQAREETALGEAAKAATAEGAAAERAGREKLAERKETSEEQLRASQAAEATAKAEHEGEPKTTQEKTYNDLMKGGAGGGPKINPATNKPYTALEAEGAVAKATEKLTAAEHVLRPDEVTSLNQGLQDRYQVLNPGKPLPAEFRLPANATRADFDRADKLLEGTEKANMTKVQKDALDEQRRKASEDKAQAKKEKEEKEGRDWVTGEDPNTGQQVMVPLSQAKEIGLKNQAKADNDTINKTLAARHVEPLLYSSDPANPGILQMIDKLDKAGKLGPLASRWNDFMARKWGGDDADYAALRARMDLATTKLMQAHVGSRGGSFMLEHFEDIANAKRMSAANLRAGIDQELRYVHDISMNAPKAAAKPAAGGAAQAIPKVGTIVDGHRFKGGDPNKEENWEKPPAGKK